MATSEKDENARRFRNVSINFDFTDKMISILEKHNCDSIITLTFIEDHDLAILCEDLSIGYKSRLNGAVKELQRLNRQSSCANSLEYFRQGDLSQEDVSHEGQFEHFCQTYHFNNDTIDVLRSYNCDSLPALRYISDYDAKLSLYNNLNSLGEKNKLCSAIDDLQGKKLPVMSDSIVTTQDVAYPSEEERKVHVKLLSELDEIEGPNYFPSVKSLARIYLKPGVVEPCQSILDICHAFERQQIIRVGKYSKLIELFKDAKLPNLVDRVKQGEKELRQIRQTKRAGVISDFEDIRSKPKRDSSFSRGCQRAIHPITKPEKSKKPIPVSDPTSPAATSHITRKSDINLPVPTTDIAGKTRELSISGTQPIQPLAEQSSWEISTSEQSAQPRSQPDFANNTIQRSAAELSTAVHNPVINGVPGNGNLPHQYQTGCHTAFQDNTDYSFVNDLLTVDTITSNISTIENIEIQSTDLMKSSLCTDTYNSTDTSKKKPLLTCESINQTASGDLSRTTEIRATQSAVCESASVPISSCIELNYGFRNLFSGESSESVEPRLPEASPLVKFYLPEDNERNTVLLERTDSNPGMMAPSINTAVPFIHTFKTSIATDFRVSSSADTTYTDAEDTPATSTTCMLTEVAIGISSMGITETSTINSKESPREDTSIYSDTKDTPPTVTTCLLTKVESGSSTIDTTETEAITSNCASHSEITDSGVTVPASSCAFENETSNTCDSAMGGTDTIANKITRLARWGFSSATRAWEYVTWNSAANACDSDQGTVLHI